MKTKVVFFDAGGTLFRPYPSVGDIYARVAWGHGVDVEPADIESRFHDAWHARNGLVSLTSLTNEKIEREWWRELVKEVFLNIGTFKDFPAFFDELYDRFAQAECWRLFDDTRPLLDHLKNAGYRMGIISNWDHRLFSIVKELGLSPYFAQVFASSAVGISKPGKRIFQKPCETFGIQPKEALHIGDSVEEDYYGAQRAGLQAILLDRPRKAYNGIVRIDTLQDLIPLFHDQNCRHARS